MSERVFLLVHSQDHHDHEGDHHHDHQQECMVALQPSHLPEAAEILDILNKIEFEVFFCTDNSFFSFVMLLSQGLFYSHDKLATLQGGQPWKKCLAEMWSKDKPQEQACLTMLMMLMLIRMMMSQKKTNISKIRGQKLETLIQFFLSILASDLRTTEHIQIQTWARSWWLMIVMPPHHLDPRQLTCSSSSKSSPH